MAGQVDTGRADLPESMQNMLAPRSNFERGAVLNLEAESTAAYGGQKTNASYVLSPEHGLVIPNGNGNGKLIVIPGEQVRQPNPNYVDARELKLKMRELAAQLVAGLEPALYGYIALPISFVPQDDYERTSSFGRFISEQMYYEFNQRGLPTSEYRLANQISLREDGEFLLTRGSGTKQLSPKVLYLVGTYYTDNQTIFVNARLIRSNGQIMRTGQIIFALSPLVKRMLASSGKKLPVGNLDLLDFSMEARPPSGITAFDMGMDVH